MSLVKVCSILLLVFISGWGIPQLHAATFADNGNKTVTDSRTGLVWQQEEPGGMTWGNALSYCEGLSLGGQDDWRLPNVKELESLTDDARYNPSIDKTYFPNAVASFYWSSTTYAVFPYYAWFVHFNGGVVNANGKDSSHYVRCVRGGQSGSFGSLSLSASPSSISFGTTDISTPSAAQALTVTNSGTNPATLGTTALGGSNSGDFSIISDVCSGQTMAAGANCVVTVRFNPTLPGTKSATLTINDATQKSAASVALSGTAVVGQPTLVIQKSSAGSGTVTSSPAGITCGAACSTAFADKALVNLTAAATDGSTFLGWSGGGCSGVSSCSVALDYAASPSTTVTASFGNTSACQLQIDDVVIKATSCTKMSNYSEFSGSISISHATNPSNPVLKIDNGKLNVNTDSKNITTPAFTSTPLYIANVKGLGDVALGKNYSFDIAGAELTSKSGQGLVAKLLKKLLIDVEINKITVGSDEALVEGRLGLPDTVLKRLHKKTGVPIDVDISSMMFSQSKGYFPGSASITVKELDITGTPVSLSDVKINLDGVKEEITIEGTVTIERLVSPTPGMAGREFTGRVTLADGGLQGFAISAGSLNIPLGTSPFYLQKIGGSVDGFKYDPVLITLKTSFSGGPKLNIGDWIGNYQTLCFNDVGIEIDPSSFMKHSGGAGILCFDSWEQAKNGAIAAQLDGEYNWKTSSFKEKGTLTFPFEVLKSTGNLSVTTQDFSGSMVGQFCFPKWKCFADSSQVINKKGIGGNVRFFDADLAFFIDWGIAKASWDTVTDHVRFGTNLNELQSKVKASGKRVGKSVGMPVADTITVPVGLGFAIIKATWQTGTSDLTLTTPDGTIINSAYSSAHPDTVQYLKLGKEAWYALKNPAAGAWQADLANLDTLGTVVVSVNTLNTPPTVAITSPAIRITSSTTVDIAYTASDPDSTPTISLHYDTDSSGGAGAKIVEGLAMPSATGTYSWDVSAVPAGVYYLYAIIDDGVNTPVIKYAAGTVEVVTQGAPAAPANFAAQANGTSIDMTWSSVSGATGYRVYYTDALDVETYPKNVVVPADSSSYSLANLKPSATYRVTVTAFDATGAEGRTAIPVTTTIAALPAPIVNVSKDTLDFGTVPLGQSQSASLTISNAGNADMTLSKADLLGTLATSCTVSSITLPVTIAPGTSATLDIMFTPLEGGTLNSTLQLSSNDPSTPKKSVALAATVPFLSYTVTPVSGAGGSMNPASPQAITANSTTSFNITASAGYAILAVSGCNGSLVGTTYTTGVITAACAVSATFSTNNYIVSFTSNGGSAVSNQTVTENTTATAPTAPTKSGNTFAGWFSDIGLANGFAFTTPITANTTLYAKWTAIVVPTITYAVTPAAGTGSTMLPATAQTITSGAATSFTIAPIAGYGILSVTGCNGTLNGSTYTTGAITGDCSVRTTAVKRNSNSGVTADPTIADALKALQAFSGIVSLTQEETIRYDVAPIAANGVPQGNGVVDIADVIMILRRSIGIGSW